jgi:hypothetical protein
MKIQLSVLNNITEFCGLNRAARKINVTPITFRRWLAVGTMPQFQFEGTGYVLQSDVDAFVEACQCRNQRKAYEPKPVKTVAS